MTEQERIAIRARAWDELHEENLRTNYGQREAPSVKIYKDTAVLIIDKVAVALNKWRKRYEKYLGIHEAGEATEKQQDLMVEAGDNVEAL